MSRFNSHSVYKVWQLADHEKGQALGMIGTHGHKGRRSCVGYLLRKSRRDMASLVALLKSLDEHSLKHNRVLTVPLFENF